MALCWAWSQPGCVLDTVLRSMNIYLDYLEAACAADVHPCVCVAEAGGQQHVPGLHRQHVHLLQDLLHNVVAQVAEE